MSIKAVFSNIKKEGLSGTFRIYQEKQNKRASKVKAKRAAYQKKLEAAGIVADTLVSVKADSSLIEQAEKLLSEIRSANPLKADKQMLKDWNEEISLLETNECRAEIKRLFIKERIPAAYKENAGSPLEDKIVFMQPRRKINQTYKYIFRAIDEKYPYTPVLCEFHRGEVSLTEHYLNAEAFAREAATAKAIMMHESNEYLGHTDIRSETKVVQLWHGCGVIKHLGLSTAGNPGCKTIDEYEEYPEYNTFDIVTITSEELRWVFEEFMGKEKGDPVIQPIGMSRTDEFFDEQYIENCYEKIHEKIPATKDKKIILYAPTYRGRDPERTAPLMPDLKLFAERLSDDYVFIIKQHQTAKNLPEIPEEYRDSFAYDMTRGKGMDINELMTVADVLISDYSSVVYEYSLFERPILFFLYDYDDYADGRGMYYTYDELAEGGEVFRTNEDMVDYIANLEKCFDREKIKAFREKYMSACDGHATERTMAFIES